MAEGSATSPAVPPAGEVALVTGASRGIGQAIVLELARLGADLGHALAADGGWVAR